MLVSIENAALEKYPEAEIGYLVAQVTLKKTDPYVEGLKQSLLKSLTEKGINATNFVAHPSVAVWRQIYEDDFQVKPKTYRSSIEALLRRVVTGKEIWSICNIVDLYNCCSLLSLLPMGGYDLEKICGNIQIRYAQEGEIFQGLSAMEKIVPKPNHVVYADDKRLICWLWNHKDSIETAIDENTKHVVFFIDSAGKNEPGKMQTALQQLAEHLENIQCVPLVSGILNKELPEVSLLYSSPK